MYREEAVDIKKAITCEFIRRKKVFVLAVGDSNQDFAYSSLNDQLCDLVNGVTIFQNGGNWRVKLFVEGDVSKSALCNRFGIRDKRDIIIENTGPITINDLRGRQRPAYMGLSIGHYKVGAGTLGCVVKDDMETGYILSNNHILANLNKCKVDDSILQPGRFDGGEDPIDQIAKLHNYIPIGFSSSDINHVDCAIAKINGDELCDPLIPVLGNIKGHQQAYDKMEVLKFGRASEKTTGYVASTEADFKCTYVKGSVFTRPKVAFFEDQLEIKGRDFRTGQSIVFSKKGDSGSIILDNQSLNAVGLLFCSAADGTTFASPIEKVLASLNVEIV